MQDTLLRATVFIAPKPSKTSYLSKKLPNTNKFSRDSKDLNCFTTQIYQKLTINHNRFCTPEEHIAYVTSRLTGLAYTQVAPRICFRKH
jgi:hypothetical protein